MFSLLLFGFLIGSYIEVSLCDCDLKNFEKAKIVPDVLPTVPKEELKVIYSDVTVSCGGFINFTKTTEPPSVYYDATGDFYTLFMIDPDYTDPKDPGKTTTFLHWSIMNIPGNDVKNGIIKAEYVKPEPPSHLKDHRYVLIICRQPSFLADFVFTQERDQFNLATELKELYLQEITAANFFYSGY